MFPESKAWIYLCVTTVDVDTAAVDELLKTYTHCEDAFTRHIATDLLSGRT
jgi:hypothetical protein